MIRPIPTAPATHRRPSRHLAALLVVLLLGACTSGPDVADGPAEDVTPDEPLEVRLEVGDAFEPIVLANPPGTTYIIAEGLHRAQFVTPDDGDRFIGEDGAVVSGAIELDPTDFEEVDGRFVAAGREEEPYRTDSGDLHGMMEEGFARDAANHDLWVDDVLHQHVETLEDLDGPGEWYFDYEADELWMGTDPTTTTYLELAVVEDFVRNPGTADVEVRNLTLTRFASPAQNGVIHASGPGWRISDVVVSESHGVGVVMADGTVLEDSRIIDNGQLGVEATGATGVVVDDVEIARNGTLGYVWFWERGGLKFKGTTDAQVLGSHVHGNRGPGIWFDIDNRGALIEGNLAEDNDVNGIFYEISFDAVIRDNQVFRNGLVEEYGTLATGIFVSISSDVLIEGNTTAGNNFEIILVHADRTEEIGPGYGVEDVVVRDNDVTITQDGGVGMYVDTGEDEYYTDRGNVFADNRYVLDGCQQCFRWGDHIDFAAWQAAGNDLEGDTRVVDAGEG